MAAEDEWYRSPDWTAEAQAHFENKLRRAREWSRPQYLRIKALSLLEASDHEGQEAGRELLRRVLREYADNGLEVVFAHELLGRAYRRARKYPEAEGHFRACIGLCESRGTRSGTSGLCDLTLVELILETAETAKYAEADAFLDYLAEHPEHLPFNGDIFRFYAARARLAHRLAQPEKAASYAEVALNFAGIKEPQLSRHPTIGLVQTDERTLRDLCTIAARKLGPLARLLDLLQP